MQRPRIPAWLYLWIAVTAILSLLSLKYRYHVESRDKAVGISVEIDTVQSLAAAQGITLEEGLKQLKAKGVNSVVIPEEYVAELLSQGKLQIANGQSVVGDTGTVQRVLRGVKNRFPNYVTNTQFQGAMNENVAIKFPDISLVRGVAVGLNPDQAAIVKDAGMTIIARCSNPSSASDETVMQTLAWAKELGAEIFLPQGEQVLGRRDSLETFIQGLRKYNLFYASPEFAKIGGDENVVEDAPDLIIRLHSAQTQELDKMPLEEAVDRYSRAARERNQRLLLLRPVSTAAPKPLDDFADFADKVAKETVKQGGVIASKPGEPHPFDDSGVPNALFALLALSVVPTAVWTFSVFFRKRGAQIAVGILLGALAAACYKPVGHPYMALVAALTFPTAAFMILDGRQTKYWFLEFIVITAISLTGGLCIAGLLNSLPYYIHAKQFMGVKFAHFFPIVLIGGFFFWRYNGVRSSLSSPMRWGAAVLAMIVLGSLGFMLARTGNDNPAAVSGAELKLRALLDIILFVRPRTKEFLIGHPFLIIGIGMLISLRRGEKRFEPYKGWIALLLMLGAIGQTSIVNTMSHLHTPLTISLARIGVGLIAGGILGGVLWWVVQRWRPEVGV